jgi:hypothetical protein
MLIYTKLRNSFSVYFKIMSVINVKVKNIRPSYYTLSDWINNPQHEYIGRSGIVFINNERFPKKIQYLG